MRPERRRHRWRIVAATAVIVVLGGAGFVGTRYVFREHPGPKSLSAAVKAFTGKGPITTSGNLSYDPPAQGVYALNGQGTERISFPPNSQSDGAVIPASVRYLTDGCWRWHVDYNIAHWEEYDFCPRGPQLLLVANRNSQSWDFGTLKINNLARIACAAITVVLPKDPSLVRCWDGPAWHQHGHTRAHDRGDNGPHCRDRHRSDRGRGRPHHP